MTIDVDVTDENNLPEVGITVSRSTDVTALQKDATIVEKEAEGRRNLMLISTATGVNGAIRAKANAIYDQRVFYTDLETNAESFQVVLDGR